MSSSFSRLSPLAFAMIPIPFVARREPRRVLCNKHTRVDIAASFGRICLNLWPSLRYLPPPSRPITKMRTAVRRPDYRRKTMAKAGQSGLEALTASLPRENRGPPPVDLWNPPFCGDIDMRVATDGTWFYQKTPIGRLSLVKLFASVLKREGEKYFLVTPVEKVGIVVDDVPFLAVEMKSSSGDHGRILQFRTNVDDWVAAGPAHALRFEQQPVNGGLKPYLHVRRELWAKVTRALFYDLVALGEEREVGGKMMFGVMSGGEFFAMAAASVLREFA
jgi:hypothetical protein